MTPTIDDVLSKHWDKVYDGEVTKYEAAKAAMTEWASIRQIECCGAWKSVEDGNLPAQGERVLVYCEGGLIEKGYRIGMLWERDWAGSTFHETGYKVTHWMPLPKSPNDSSPCKVDELRKEIERLNRLFTSITPGGSEFVNDPEYCIKFIKENDSQVKSIIRNQSKRISELEEENNKLIMLTKQLLK